MEASVLCFVDDAHAATAKTFHDAVVREGLADERIRACHVDHILGWGKTQVNEDKTLNGQQWRRIWREDVPEMFESRGNRN